MLYHGALPGGKDSEPSGAADVCSSACGSEMSRSGALCLWPHLGRFSFAQGDGGKIEIFLNVSL